MTDQVNEANMLSAAGLLGFTRLYHALNALLGVVGRDGEIDSRHPATTAVMEALRAIDGGHYQPEFQATHPARGVVDEAFIAKLGEEAFRVHSTTRVGPYPNDSHAPKWQAVVRMVIDALGLQAAQPAVPSVPELTTVLDALDAVNEAANDARHRGEYGKANKLVNARVTLYRAALANEEAATPKDQPAQGVDGG